MMSNVLPVHVFFFGAGLEQPFSIAPLGLRIVRHVRSARDGSHVLWHVF